MSSQIERRFEISSSIVGIIDGSFEIGMCTFFESGEILLLNTFFP